MADTIMIFKCPLCKKWQQLYCDPECSCGLAIDDPGDANANPKNTALETRILDINKAVEALERIEKPD